MASKNNLASWFDPDRRKPSPPELGYTQYLIGMIYFRTNERRLDPHDLEILHRLAGFVTQELAHGRAVELSLVGMADYRGRASHNRWLSEQRVKAVADSLGRNAGNRSSFTGVWAAAIGEEQAAEFRDGFINSLDRVVHVWSGRPRMHIMPRLRRYVFGKGFLDQIRGHDHLIDLSPPSRPRRLGSSASGLIDL